MRTMITTIISSFFVCCLNAQSKTQKNAIGISIPVIWNNSEIKRGSSSTEKGNAISYGINLNYSRTIASKFYGLIGVGYYKQRFGIPRYYNISTSNSGPATYAMIYHYNNLHLRLGIGYTKDVRKNLSYNGLIDLNEYVSFRQKYTQEVNFSHNGMSIGESLNLHLSMNNFVSKNISVTPELVFPFWVNWKTDKAFDADSEIARNNLSLGIAISGKYHF